MNPPAPPVTKEAQSIKTHPYPILLTLALGLLLLGHAPLKAADSVIETKDDAVISTAVKKLLLFNLSFDFKVQTHEGVVTLIGGAGNIAERDLNTVLATSVVGVKHVVNQMVTPPILAKNN